MTAASAPQTIPDRIAAEWPPETWRDVNVVLAVSGGADSVALLLATHQIWQTRGGAGELVVTHVNHQLRGDQSDGDADWVGALADRLNLRFELRRCDPPPAGSHSGESLEGFLRRQRYQLLADVARQAGARWLCTAHHANDQAETVLFRILRGTGLDGLAGIPRRRTIDGGITICRPLLDVTRVEIVDWLQTQNQSWRTDFTNADTAFSRNRIRNEIMPVLQNHSPVDLVKSLSELACSAGELRQTLNHVAGGLIEDHFRFNDQGFDVHPGSQGLDDSNLWAHALRLAWQRMDWPLRDMSRQKWLLLVQALRSVVSGQVVSATEFPGRVRVTTDAGILRCQRQA